MSDTNKVPLMPIKSVYDLYNLMADNNLVMIYVGEFNQDITKTVLAMTERTFDADEVDTGVRKKVFNIMVEVLQNICKHQSEGGSVRNMSVFMIGETDSEFLIISGNPILNNKIKAVKERVDEVNSLDKEGLRALYKKVRLNATISDVGGAGLGFIDMGRKSGKPLLYSFSEIDNDFSFFVLQISVSKIETND